MLRTTMIPSRRRTPSRNRNKLWWLLPVTALFLMCCRTLFVFPTWHTPQIHVDSQNSILPELHALTQEALHLAMTSTSLYNSSRPKATRTSLQVFLGCVAHIAAVSNDLNASDTFSLHSNLNTSTNQVCDQIGTTPFADPWDTSVLCHHLIGMKILIVGSHLTYSLHNTLLDILPSGSQGSQFRCHGPALCTWHEICSPFFPTTQTPFPPAQRHRMPPHDLSNSAILRFSMSTTVCTSVLDKGNLQPYVSPLTGVREHNTQDWLEKVRRSDMVIISKGPVPAPAWSYVSSNKSSNHKFSVRIPRPGSREWNRMEPFISLLVPRGVLRDFSVVEAAWKATIVKWLPELIETLICLRMENLATKGRLLVWLGSSFATGCTSRMDKAIRNNQTDFPWLQECVGCDERCIFENVQVYIQNMILNQILPSIGVLYIPEANPSSSQSNSPSTSPGTLTENRQVMVENSTKHRDDVFLRGLIAILRGSKQGVAHDAEEV